AWRPIPDGGLKWQYVPPCVALDWWPQCRPPAGAPFTTVTQWYMNEWMEDAGGWYQNDKRSGFLPFLDLPQETTQVLELAVHLEEDIAERMILEGRGWRVREAHAVAFTPWDYQRYLQDSLG